MSGLRRLETDRNAVYHVWSHGVDDKPIFKTRKLRDYFLHLMWKQSRLTGVQILAYAIMDTHFHMLVRVLNPSLPPPDDEFLKRMHSLDASTEVFTKIAKNWIDQKNAPPSRPSEAVSATPQEPSADEIICRRYLARMNNLPFFVGSIKQAFTLRYNQIHDREGVLWSSRYGSNLIEDDPEQVAPLAAYVDLNPVRAGLVIDPLDYDDISYTMAVGGNKELRQAIQDICGPACKTWKQAQAQYRRFLYITGGAAHQAGKKTIPAEEIAKVLAEGGQLDMPQFLRTEVKYFERAVAIGSVAYLEGLRLRHPEWFAKSRKTVARPMRGLHCKEYTDHSKSARDLRT